MACVVRGSWLVQSLERILGRGTAAWRDSVAGSLYGQLVHRMEAYAAVERIRLAGGVCAVAAATALALQRLSPRPEPLTWILPALFLGVGICLMMATFGRSAR